MRKRQLPEAVRRTLSELRKERGAYVEVKYRKKSSYYTFEGTSRFEKGTGRRVKINSYIGRIDEKGRFIPARHRSPGLMHYLTNFLPKAVMKEMERIKSRYKDAEIGRIEEGKFYVYSSGAEQARLLGIIDENGFFTSSDIDMSASKKDFRVSNEEQSILSCLSMNARMPFSTLSKLSGLREQAAYSKAKALEKRFGIRYILELNTLQLGFSPFMIFVKFHDTVPSVSIINEALSDWPNIQFAALTKGEYDLVIYLLEENTEKVGDKVWDVRSKGHFRDYAATWYVSPFGQTYGLVPLRMDFFDNVLKEKERKRGEELQGRFRHRELALMKELNRNGAADFASIDKHMGYGRGASQYTYYRLRERGIIQRCTVNMEGLPLKYNAMIIATFENMARYYETRNTLLQNIITYNGPTNRYCLSGDIGTPNAGLLMMPVLSETDLESAAEFLRTNIQGVSVSTLVITNIIIGSLCYRRFDNAYSRQYKRLEDAGIIEPKPKTNYG